MRQFRRKLGHLIFQRSCYNDKWSYITTVDSGRNAKSRATKLFVFSLVIHVASHECLSYSSSQWRHMSVITSQSTGNYGVCFVICSGYQQRKYQRSILLALCDGQPSVTSGFIKDQWCRKWFHDARLGHNIPFRCGVNVVLDKKNVARDGRDHPVNLKSTCRCV